MKAIVFLLLLTACTGQFSDEQIDRAREACGDLAGIEAGDDGTLIAYCQDGRAVRVR